MKRLYTELEFVRFYGWIPFVLFVGFISQLILQHNENSDILPAILISAGVLILLELAIFIIWYPKEYKRKRAIRYGKQYVGCIKSIERKTKNRYTVYKRNYVFVITIEADVNGKTYTIEEGDFSDDPGKFVCRGDKCKVYWYNSKLYPEFFMKDVKKAKRQIADTKANLRQVHMAVSPLSYIHRNEKKDVLVLITLKAYKSYNSAYFSLQERISGYLDNSEKNGNGVDEDLLRNEIKEIIEKAIKEKDEFVEIQEVKIIIK